MSSSSDIVMSTKNVTSAVEIKMSDNNNGDKDNKIKMSDSNNGDKDNKMKQSDNNNDDDNDNKVKMSDNKSSTIFIKTISCQCGQIICTCIHLNGHFNNPIINHVLTLRNEIIGINSIEEPSTSKGITGNNVLKNNCLRRKLQNHYEHYLNESKRFRKAETDELEETMPTEESDNHNTSNSLCKENTDASDETRTNTPTATTRNEETSDHQSDRSTIGPLSSFYSSIVDDSSDSSSDETVSSESIQMHLSTLSSSSSSSSSSYTPSSTTLSPTSNISTPSLSAVNINEENNDRTDRTENRFDGTIVSFVRFLSRALNNSDLNNLVNDLSDVMSTSDDDDDDRSTGTDNSTRSDIAIPANVIGDDNTDNDDDINSVENQVGSPRVDDTPPALLKPQPQPKWFPLNEVMQRQYGTRTRYPNPTLFRDGYHGSLLAVKRLTVIHKLVKHKGCVNSLNFHPQGQLLASCSDDKKICIWDWSQSRCLHTYASGHSRNVFQSKWLHLLGYGHIVSSGRDGMIRFQDLNHLDRNGLDSSRLLAKHKASVDQIALHMETPHVILSAGEDGRILNVDIRTTFQNNKPIIKHNQYNRVPWYSIAINPCNSNEFIVAGKRQYVAMFDRRFINPTRSKAMRRFLVETKSADTKPHISSVAYNYNGTEIIASSTIDKIHLFDCKAPYVEAASENRVNEFLHSYGGHKNRSTIKGITFFGPKSEYIISGSDDRHIYIWDKKTEAIVNWMKADTRIVNFIEPHPNLPVLASCGLDSSVKIWMPLASKNPSFTNLKKTILRNENNLYDLFDRDRTVMFQPSPYLEEVDGDPNQCATS